MREFFKSLAKKLAPKTVVREVILQPNLMENDGKRIVGQVCRDGDGVLHLVFRAEDETSLNVQVTPDTAARLRELLAALSPESTEVSTK